MTREEYWYKAKEMWQTYVPKSGKAETVQGELIRTITKLKDEAHRNGNINWDEGHEIFVEYLRFHLTSSNTFDLDEKEQIEKDLNRILEYEEPYTEDDLYERLTNRVVDWCLANPEPIKHELNPELDR